MWSSICVEKTTSSDYVRNDYGMLMTMTVVIIPKSWLETKGMHKHVDTATEQGNDLNFTDEEY